MVATHSPDPVNLLAGPGTAAQQAARPRQYANHQAGGYQPTAPVWATGATAGTPGGFTPAPSYIPEDVQAMTDRGVTATPATAWTTGQRVITYDGKPCSWNGSAWVSGQATVAAKKSGGTTTNEE